MAIARALTQVITDAEPAAGATETSSEQDFGDDTIFDQIWLYISVAGFAAAPAGNEQIIAWIEPVHTTAGTAYDDEPIQHVRTADTDQAYYWAIPLTSLSRYFKLSIKNDTGQAIDTNGLDAWIECQKIT